MMKSEVKENIYSRDYGMSAKLSLDIHEVLISSTPMISPMPLRSYVFLLKLLALRTGSGLLRELFLTKLRPMPQFSAESSMASEQAVILAPMGVLDTLDLVVCNPPRYRRLIA